jgi:hypothetical protein
MITESASPHHIVGAMYPEHFKEIMENYSPQKVFILDETGEFGKKMPMRSFISENEKICLKVSEDCVTLFISLNALGIEPIK